MKEQNQVDNDEANNNKQQRQHSFKKAAATARLCSAPRGGDVLAHPASPAADDPDLQLHPGGAVPRHAADEVAPPVAAEPDGIAAGMS